MNWQDEILAVHKDQTGFFKRLKTNHMKIIQTFKGEKEGKEVTEERFIELTEGRGYWKEGTALDELKRNKIVQVSFSYFEIN